MINKSENWRTLYLPPDAKLWHGRVDSPENACFFQIMKMLNLLNDIKIEQTKQPQFALLGFCCDVGVQRNLGRRGAALGPIAIRPILANLNIPKPEIICYDAGSIVCSGDDLEGAQNALALTINRLHTHHITPIVIGGGHEVALGSYLGSALTFPDAQIGIINFDAHFDMRDLPATGKGSSGTPFRQIALALQQGHKRFDYTCIGIQPVSNSYQLFKTAETYHVHTILAEDIYAGSSVGKQAISQAVANNDKIYMSLCLDVFAQSYAPGVSAPQVLGLTPWQVIPLVRQIASSGKTICYDIAELAPPHDLDNRTIKLAAQIVYEIINNHVVGS